MLQIFQTIHFSNLINCLIAKESKNSFAIKMEGFFLDHQNYKAI